MVAQESSVSPYSRFGLGDPSPGGFTTNFMMGGLGIGIVDPVHINPLNPATLSYLRSPGFELGVRGAQETLANETTTSTDGYSRLDHFSLGLPMGKGKWGASLGLRPYTVRGFKGAESRYVPELDVDQQSDFEGEGGLNIMDVSVNRRLKLINDTSKYQSHSYLSVSATMGYYFGSQRLLRNSSFPNNNGFHNTKKLDNTTVSDITVSGSLLWRMPVNKRRNDEDSFSWLNIGAVLTPSSALSASRTRQVSSFVGTPSEIEIPRDSISDISDVKGSVVLPTYVGVGASMEFYFKPKRGSGKRKVVIGADYRSTAWSEAASEFGGLNDDFSELKDASDLIVGLQYSPSLTSTEGQRGNLFRMGTYRLGGRMSETHLRLDNTDISEFGMSFGASFPILTAGRKTTDTEFSLGAEYGVRGTTDNGLVEETFTRIMVGFVFHPSSLDRWFQRRKYD